MLKEAVVRGVFPFIIMTAISLIMKYQKMDAFQVRSTFIVGIIVTVVASASVIYDIENWSLFKQSIVHFLIMLITVFPCLIVSGWFELNTPIDYLKVLLIFMLVGIILWVIAYFIFGKLLSK
ncbi:DUF3021 family protein [Peptostreptococcus canis]|uniref:DUF3021 family protein n=1 Tax=Peptostreptococcus canis TaxID=1159213 RepID=A0ABR6TMR0_9FIRM|nr:DUF3021 family protein [Peptostreptococcus canis]MBC2576706.1 DUF3021 family protein [Peptostreptococcus canis]MBP1998445.1 hypothetical protein [Peptostreptococcus canis]